jgi:hypothetical protein
MSSSLKWSPRSACQRLSNFGDPFQATHAVSAYVARKRHCFTTLIPRHFDARATGKYKSSRCDPSPHRCHRGGESRYDPPPPSLPQGVEPDNFSFNAVLSANARCGRWKRALQVAALMRGMRGAVTLIAGAVDDGETVEFPVPVRTLLAARDGVGERFPAPLLGDLAGPPPPSKSIFNLLAKACAQVCGATNQRPERLSRAPCALKS